MDETPEAPRPTVQLRHELPDGTWHIDWMLARDPVGRRPLITFRAPGRIDDLDGELRIDLGHGLPQPAQVAPGATAHIQEGAGTDLAARSRRLSHRVETPGQHAEHRRVVALLDQLVDPLDALPDGFDLVTVPLHIVFGLTAVLLMPWLVTRKRSGQPVNP